MQRQEFRRPRRHGLQAARRETGQRSRRPRRNRQWQASAGDPARDRAQDRNLLPAAERKLMAATPSTTASTRDKLLRARAASAHLAQLSTEDKDALLLKIADVLEAQEKSILAANHKDVETSRLDGAMRDRLLLTPARIHDM